MRPVEIPLKRLDDGLPVPGHAHPGDGGVDLYARDPVRLEPGQRAVVPTGIAIAIPEGYAGLVTPRSGLAARNGISVVNGPGLVDAGYRGEVKVVLVNLATEPFEIARGDRVAQLVVVPVVAQDFVPVDELPDSMRGAGGFGSTGA
jgi:dUTP pyrophosphatase